MLHRVRGRLRVHLDVEAELRDESALLLEPFAIRRLLREVELRVDVLLEDARLEVEGDHVARAQAALAHYILVVDLDHTSLRHEADQAVLRLQEARGAQSVTVELRAQLLAVAEDEEGGAVPRLLHTYERGGIGEGTGVSAVPGCTMLAWDVAVLCLTALWQRGREGTGPAHLHARIVLEHVDNLRVVVIRRLVTIGLRHEDGQRLCRRLVESEEVLKHGVEVGRVAARERAQRIAPRALDVQSPLPVDVADQSVDLAVVREASERLRQGPLRVGVGREAPVVDCKVRLERRVHQVAVEGP